MAELSLHVEDAKFQAALRDLAVATRKPYSEVIKRNARLIGVNLAFQTQPFGDNSSAKEKGEAAVRRDMKRVFADAPDTYKVLWAVDKEMAKAFYLAMLKKDWPEAQRILQASSTRWRNVELSAFDSSHHRRSRNRRGRVSRHVPAQIITTGGKKLDAYTAQKVRMVGYGKAGWAAATMRLSGNTRGIPQFVTRHKNKAPGSARDLTNAILNPHAVLVNEVPYVNTICPPSQIANALNIQREKMMASIEKELSKAAQKFNRS
jgi:hypothetical protein